MIQEDLTSMYNQVLIPPRDRDALRFIWYKGGKLVHLCMTTHLFGGMWCDSSASYAFLKTVADNPGVDPLVCKAIIRVHICR